MHGLCVIIYSFACQFSLPYEYYWYCYNQKQSSGGDLQKRCSYEFCKIKKKKHLTSTSFLKKLQIYRVYQKDYQKLYLKKKFRPMFSCEFCEISQNTFFKEPFGRLLLHKHLSSFQKCLTFFPAKYFLGLIWRLGKWAQYFKPLAWSLFSTQSNICDAAFLAKIVNSWYCYGQKQSSGGVLQKRCPDEFYKIHKKTTALESRF